MSYSRTLSISTLLLAVCLRVFAAVSLTPEPSGRAVVIENETLKLVLDPDRGGSVVSFIHKASNRDIIPRDKKYMGLFMDHLWGQGWPGELLEVPYEMQVTKSGPEEVVVQVWRTVAGSWQGLDQKIIRGLVVEKTFTVKSGVDAVFCRVVVRNPQPEGRLPAYWTQNVFFAGGDYDTTDDLLFRPSTRGVKASWQGGRTDDFLRDPIAGWSAAVDRKNAQGLVFLMDYNDLDMLYDCMGNLTLEWMFDKIPVPAGREWSTEEVLIPTEGISDFAHASRNLIAGLTATRSSNELRVTHHLRAALSTAKNVSLTLEVVGATDRKSAVAPPLPAGDLSTEVKTLSHTAVVSSPDPLMLNVTATGEHNGQPFEEHYHVFFPGSYGYADNVQQDMQTPLIKLARPEKHQELMRPAKIERTRNGEPHIFILRGLHPYPDLETATGRMDYLTNTITKVWKAPTVRVGTYSIGQEGPRTTDFPFDYDALMSQDLIIVDNANVQCLGKLGLEMLRDYLTHGGNLLILGGKASYGGGGLVGSGLEDLLPVAVSRNPFDIERNPKGYLALATPQPFFKPMNFTKPVLCPYIHRVEVKEEGQVLITAGKRPFLVARDLTGGGRIACLLGAPYDPKDWWKTDSYLGHEYGHLMGYLLEWVTRVGASG